MVYFCCCLLRLTIYGYCRPSRDDFFAILFFQAKLNITSLATHSPKNYFKILKRARVSVISQLECVNGRASRDVPKQHPEMKIMRFLPGQLLCSTNQKNRIAYCSQRLPPGYA